MIKTRRLKNVAIFIHTKLKNIFLTVTDKHEKKYAGEAGPMQIQKYKVQYKILKCWKEHFQENR